MRTIDADKLVDKFDHMVGKEYSAIMIPKIVEIIKEEPTLDVKPVIHARWVGETDRALLCSNCKNWIFKPEFTNNYGPNYCAWCGAKMSKGGS